ncbi:hypothetical protein AArcMg_3008 [Natrarchaeobaculum sulfurireducens]|uniref:Transcriptional regulator, ArsR family n=1 Tax=Natrarchaeobaculum sulfurireducens TaxID=2044521 RepID=A0A346PBZ3_9EURY|nr:hypothetical protein [Natrarchaeobaculum sulfurireducens]AXR77038.1 Transcriptional regulator, ArsR family [Natrarchaeobaculum sulfurireducens]AXR82996.1 hypothetical protein AArcMg_3008 [Natrarchaeobaculum sulfurireducens]
MTITSTNVDSAGTAACLPTDTVFELLLDERRRDAMAVLSHRSRGLSLDHLIDLLVARAGTGANRWPTRGDRTLVPSHPLQKARRRWRRQLRFGDGHDRPPTRGSYTRALSGARGP